MFNHFFCTIPRHILIIGIILFNGLILSFIFPNTTQSLISIWWRSDTYQYGFLILPISLWLIWRERHTCQNLAINPTYYGFIAFIISAFIWLFGELVEAGVIAQYGFVLMFISSLWGVLGNTLFKQLLFPILYLILMVPVGEDLIPPLMEFTATFTAETIRLIGIPIYREGMYISLPSGDWSVVEACSGIRYLLSSVVLGTLFAYLTYQSLFKRMLFIIASFIVPILANGIRAFLIVMIGHLSDKKLATGVDHLIYGWVFFGIVMFILFAIGNKWQDPLPEKKGDSTQKHEPCIFDKRMGVMAFILIGTTFFVQHTHNRLFNLAPPIVEKNIFPTQTEDWFNIKLTDNDWHPITPHAILVEENGYFNHKEKLKIGIYQAYFSGNNKSKLISTSNIWVDDKNIWRISKKETSNLLGFDVNELIIYSHNTRILVWSWYEIGDKATNNRYYAKLYELQQRLFEHKSQTKQVYYFIVKPRNMDIPSLRKQLKKAVLQIKNKTTLS